MWDRDSHILSVCRLLYWLLYINCLLSVWSYWHILGRQAEETDEQSAWRQRKVSCPGGKNTETEADSKITDFSTDRHLFPSKQTSFHRCHECFDLDLNLEDSLMHKWIMFLWRLNEINVDVETNSISWISVFHKEQKTLFFYFCRQMFKDLFRFLIMAAFPNIKHASDWTCANLGTWPGAESLFLNFLSVSALQPASLIFMIIGWYCTLCYILPQHTCVICIVIFPFVPSNLE